MSAVINEDTGGAVGQRGEVLENGREASLSDVTCPPRPCAPASIYPPSPLYFGALPCSTLALPLPQRPRLTCLPRPAPSPQLLVLPLHLAFPTWSWY